MEEKMTDIRLHFREANIEDVAAIVLMLSDDPLGANRERFENPLPEPYLNEYLSCNSTPSKE